MGIEGVVVVNLRDGRLLYHRSFARNFGLPASPSGVEGEAAEPSHQLAAGGAMCATCKVLHSDEMNLAALLFAVHSYAGQSLATAPA
jgi:hypothetical protein